MGCGQFTCSKNALLSLNILYILISILLIAVAAYAKAISLVSSLTIIGAVIGCGVFLLFIACMGFIGALKHHQICLFFYMVVLFILFLVQFSLAVALLAITKDTQTELVEEGWDQASNETRRDGMNLGQCCGLKPWTEGDLKCLNTLTCCVDNPAMGCCEGGSTTSSTPCTCESCEAKLEGYLNTACKITGGVGMFISLTEIFGVVVTVRYRGQRNPLSNADHYL